MNNTNRNTTMTEHGDKAMAGLPYLYRSKGLPSEVYEIRLNSEIDEAALNLSIADTIDRYPYFGVMFQERDGDFYAVKNPLPLKAICTDGFIPLGGHSNQNHLMGVTFWENTLKLSFHHGLTDGRGAKAFLETLVQYYADYISAGHNQEEITSVKERHDALAAEFSEEEYADPCAVKHALDGNGGKVEGLARKGYKLPESTSKSEHRRYEIRFSQDAFMNACRAIGASPIIYLSILMSRGIKTADPACDKPVVSNFPMDARAILGYEKTFKNCVKSMSLPYGEEEAALSDTELAAKYKALLQAQKNHDHCAKEFNNIHMLLEVISHFHSFASRQKLLGFMEDLSLDTYLISYIGQFQMPRELVREVHLYSNCSSGLVLNMTCQSEAFVIDLTQDFESEKYVNTLKEQFDRIGVPVTVSDEILFETPYDELKEIITSPATTGEQVKGFLGKIAEAAKASTEAAKERAEAAKAMGTMVNGPKITALYYCIETGTMKEFDPTKTTLDDLRKHHTCKIEAIEV